MKELELLNKQVSLEQLNAFILSENMLEKLLLQIEKDFTQCGVDLDFNNKQYPLLNEIRNTIHKLAVDDNQKLQNLLYRVDVSQKRIRVLTENQPHTPFEDILTLAIVHREAQKIIIRDNFT